jgi:hypothetical protein
LPQFAGAVRRLAPNLRAVGVHVSFEREEHFSRRVITLSVCAPELALEATRDTTQDGPPDARDRASDAGDRSCVDPVFHSNIAVTGGDASSERA